MVKFGDPVGSAARNGGKRNSLCISSHWGLGMPEPEIRFWDKCTLGRDPYWYCISASALRDSRTIRASRSPAACASSYSSSIQAKAREARTAALATTRAKPKRRRARPRHRGLDRQGACASERAGGAPRRSRCPERAERGQRCPRGPHGGPRAKRQRVTASGTRRCGVAHVCMRRPAGSLRVRDTCMVE